MSIAKDIYMSDDDDEESDESPQTAKKSKKRQISSDSDTSSSSSSSSSKSEGEEEIEYNDGYDDNYVGDEEDRRRLEGMSEKEREQEIYNRVERREVALKKLEIQKKLKERISKKHVEKAPSKKMPLKKTKKTSDAFINDDDSDTSEDEDDEDYQVKKPTKIMKNKPETKSKNVVKLKNQVRSESKSRVGDDNDVEGGGGRRVGRLKDKDKKINALNDLKVAREGLQKKKEIKKNSAADIYSSSSSSSSLSSSSSSSSSESDDDNDRKNKSDKEEEEVDEDFEFTLEHMNSLRLSRFRLESWCFHPNFKQMVHGCFVRVSIGNNPHTRAPVYRVAQVVDVVTTGKIYYLSDKKNRTNKGLKLRHAAAERMYRLQFISNQAVSATEFARWKESMEKYQQAMPTKSMVNCKRKEVLKGKALHLNEGEIDSMVREKLQFRKTPFNYAIKKTELMKLRETAIENEDVAKAREVANELEELEEEATRLDERRTNNIKELKLINERNRKLNMINAEESCRLDFKEAQNAVADPFTRRHCRPALVTMSNRFKSKQEEEGGVVPATEEDEEENDDTTDPAHHRAQPTTSHDLFHIHDFELNLTFDLNSKLPKEIDSILHQPSVSTPANLAIKPTIRSLNLAEYKKKRGLI